MSDKTPEEIFEFAKNEICRIYGVEPDVIMKNDRNTKNTFARSMLYYVLNKGANMSFTVIGKMAGRDHSTILAVVKKTKMTKDRSNPLYTPLQQLMIWLGSEYRYVSFQEKQRQEAAERARAAKSVKLIPWQPRGEFEAERPPIPPGLKAPDFSGDNLDLPKHLWK